jgi:energy-coupling factor transport system substrate-specific component
MTWSKQKQFFITFCAFFVLGASFKVMTLVHGLTEVRPVNAIPLIAGLMFGPIGALGCAVGNVMADFFGTLDMTSVLGFIGNFIAAYLPYRMWHIYSKETPNLHTWRNIFLYITLSLVSSMTVAYILAFGLELFFGFWIKNLYLYILYNNAGFSICLGMPLLIVFTSDSINITCSKAMDSLLPFKINGLKKYIFVIFTIFMFIMMLGVYNNYSMTSSLWMNITGLLSMLLLILLLI